MANKRGKVELKVYKPPGLDKEVAVDPSWFTRRFIIDGIECGGIFCDSETKKDFTLRGCREPFDFYRFSKTDYESGTCFVVGYPAGILIAEVIFITCILKMAIHFIVKYGICGGIRMNMQLVAGLHILV